MTKKFCHVCGDELNNGVFKEAFITDTNGESICLECACALAYGGKTGIELNMPITEKNADLIQFVKEVADNACRNDRVVGIYSKNIAPDLERMIRELEMNDEYSCCYDEEGEYDEYFSESVKYDKKMLNAKSIKEYLDKYVIAQEKAKKVISVAISNHYKRIFFDKTIQKSNILLAGPSGTGKTEIARTIARYLDVPFAVCDATSLTEAGYVGEDVENMLRSLVAAANGDIEKAERGIIYIDEIDKIARKGENMSITRDVSGEGVQQSLLKIVEGAEIEVAEKGQRKHPGAETFIIDTSNILFIAAGAFEGLTYHKKDDVRTNRIGFITSEEPDKAVNEDKGINAKQLIKFGMMPELVGRFPVITSTERLTDDDMIRILTEPENAITKQYEHLLAIDGIELKFTKEYFKDIISAATANETGARGLRGVIEESLLDVMYEASDYPEGTKVTLGKRVKVSLPKNAKSA